MSQGWGLGDLNPRAIQDAIAADDSAREFEVLVSALRVPLCQATSKQLLVVAKYLSDTNLTNDFIDALNTARRLEGSRPHDA